MEDGKMEQQAQFIRLKTSKSRGRDRFNSDLFDGKSERYRRKKIFDKMKEEQNHHQEKLIKTSGLKNKLAQTLVCSADKSLSKESLRMD